MINDNAVIELRRVELHDRLEEMVLEGLAGDTQITEANVLLVALDVLEEVFDDGQRDNEADILGTRKVLEGHTHHLISQKRRHRCCQD